MPNSHTPFWIALLKQCRERERRIRLWNGYLGWKLPPKIKGEEPQSGWPQLIADVPPGGWPQLTEDERTFLDKLAVENGGHPSWGERPYMDLSGNTFESETDLSDLTFVDADFSNAHFRTEVRLERTQFFAQSWFGDAVFEAGILCHETFFEADVHFTRAQFRSYAGFTSVQFNGGATFAGAVFECPARFDDSKFVETFFSSGITVLYLADFKGVKFLQGASFRNVVFGEDPKHSVKRIRPKRLADFSDARFLAATDFRQAVFNSVPAFFNCSLHEDTDFGRVEWPKVMPEPRRADDVIRAWERLELMMSELEKPLDRHRFYRFKMRVRRLTDGRFLRVLNWLFDVTSDYGWSISRAAIVWVAHWSVSGLFLFANAGQAAIGSDSWKLIIAALGTAFANAHAFLSLAGKGGYLESCRVLIEQHDQGGFLTAIGVVQAILGPVFLFLLLLTVRNRFRLA